MTWLTLICTLPAVLLCSVRHLTSGINYKANDIVYVLANVAWLVENMSKHTQFVGYLAPKCISILYNWLIDCGMLMDIPGIEILVPVIAAGFIGVTASRNHFKKPESTKQEVVVDEKRRTESRI